MPRPPNRSPTSFTAVARLGLTSYASVTRSPKVNVPRTPCADLFIFFITISIGCQFFDGGGLFVYGCVATTLAPSARGKTLRWRRVNFIRTESRYRIGNIPIAETFRGPIRNGNQVERQRKETAPTRGCRVDRDLRARWPQARERCRVWKMRCRTQAPCFHFFQQLSRPEVAIHLIARLH